MLEGKRVAVAGMGVSGLAAAEALTAKGACVTVLEQRPADSGVPVATLDRLQALGADLITGWSGRIDPDEFDLLVVSPGFPVDHPAIRDMTSREVWGEIELAYRITEAPIIAITGTNGKSTTAVLTWQLLKAEGKDAVLCGNIAGSGYPEVPLTKAALESGPEAFLVAEVSSFQLETISTFRAVAAAITNISPDHLDRHGSLEEYAAAKRRIFENQEPGDLALDGPPSGFDLQVSQAIPGEHGRANAAIAWALANHVVKLGPKAEEALRTFSGLAHRLERIGERNGVSVVNNSMCTNPAALIASLEALGPRQHVLMGGKRKNFSFVDVGPALQAGEHRAYLMGDEAEPLNAELGGEWPIFPGLKDAFAAAAEKAGSGEAIALSPGCASAAPYANFRERGDAFRAIAQEWLES